MVKKVIVIGGNAGGASAAPATPGEVLFIMNYGLYLIGARKAAPNDTPTTYT